MASPGGYLADVRAHDILLDIGAGDSFADIYTDKRFAYIMVTKAIPILVGTPLVLSPQTIEPLSRQPHASMAAWACRKAKFVFARDPLSMDVLRKLAAKANAKQPRHGAHRRRLGAARFGTRGGRHRNHAAGDHRDHLYATAPGAPQTPDFVESRRNGGCRMARAPVSRSELWAAAARESPIEQARSFAGLVRRFMQGRA